MNSHRSILLTKDYSSSGWVTNHPLKNFWKFSDCRPIYPISAEMIAKIRVRFVQRLTSRDIASDASLGHLFDQSFLIGLGPMKSTFPRPQHLKDGPNRFFWLKNLKKTAFLTSPRPSLVEKLNSGQLNDSVISSSRHLCSSWSQSVTLPLTNIEYIAVITAYL